MNDNKRRISAALNPISRPYVLTIKRVSKRWDWRIVDCGSECPIYSFHTRTKLFSF